MLSFSDFREPKGKEAEVYADAWQIFKTLNRWTTWTTGKVLLSYFYPFLFLKNSILIYFVID